jgi:hypothetical protein
MKTIEITFRPPSASELRYCDICGIKHALWTMESREVRGTIWLLCSNCQGGGP